MSDWDFAILLVTVLIMCVICLALGARYGVQKGYALGHHDGEGERYRREQHEAAVEDAKQKSIEELKAMVRQMLPPDSDVDPLDPAQVEAYVNEANITNHGGDQAVDEHMECYETRSWIAKLRIDAEAKARSEGVAVGPIYGKQRNVTSRRLYRELAFIDVNCETHFSEEISTSPGIDISVLEEALVSIGQLVQVTVPSDHDDGDDEPELREGTFVYPPEARPASELLKEVPRPRGTTESRDDYTGAYDEVTEGETLHSDPDEEKPTKAEYASTDDLLFDDILPEEDRSELDDFLDGIPGAAPVHHQRAAEQLERDEALYKKRRADDDPNLPF